LVGWGKTTFLIIQPYHMNFCVHAKATYPLRPQISVHLAQKLVHKRVYFSLFNAFLSRKKCFSHHTRIMANSIFLIFLHALSSLEVEKLKRREMVCVTFPMQKSLIFLKTQTYTLLWTECTSVKHMNLRWTVVCSTLRNG
jgi:hypothetical protein